MFKDYYRLLDIDKNATEKDVKRSFRHLAMEYHPDSTDSPEAHRLFLDINEAYQTLSDAFKRKAYDRKYAYFVQEDGKIELEPQRIYTPPYQTPSPSAPFPFQTDHRYVFSKGISMLALVFVMVLGLDYFLAEPTLPQIVQNGFMTVNPEGEKNCQIQTNELSFHLAYDRFGRIGKGDIITLKTTPFFGIHTLLEVWKEGEVAPARFSQIRNQQAQPISLQQVDSFIPYYGIYNVFSIVIFALLITSVTGVFLQKGPEILFKVGLLNTLLLVINAFVLLQS